MRDNRHYALDDPEAVRELIRRNPWCTFVSFVPGRGQVVSHDPVLLDDAENLEVLARLVDHFEDRLPAVVAVHSPQSSRSPITGTAASSSRV